jgi:hypothetical protein
MLTTKNQLYADLICSGEVQVYHSKLVRFFTVGAWGARPPTAMPQRV